MSINFAKQLTRYGKKHILITEASVIHSKNESYFPTPMRLKRAFIGKNTYDRRKLKGAESFFPGI